VKYAASTWQKINSASGLLKRNISVATGVSAKTAAPSSAATCDRTVRGVRTPPERVVNSRRRVAYRTPTEATPSSASGTRMLHELSPNSRTDRPISHSEAGGLSTVIALPASSEP